MSALVDTGDTPAVDARILDAAELLLARFGYSKTTIDDIAREARIGKGSVYLYFPSKEAVALAIIDRMVVDVVSGLRDISQRSGRIDARLRQMIMARILMRFDRLRPFADGLHDLLSAIRPALMAQREKHLSAEEAVFSRAIEVGIKEAGFHRIDPRSAARALLDASNSLLPYYLSPRQLGSRSNVERRASRLADLLVRGLACKGRGSL